MRSSSVSVFAPWALSCARDVEPRCLTQFYHLSLRGRVSRQAHEQLQRFLSTFDRLTDINFFHSARNGCSLDVDSPTINEKQDFGKDRDNN